LKITKEKEGKEKGSQQNKRGGRKKKTEKRCRELKECHGYSLPRTTSLGPWEAEVLRRDVLCQKKKGAVLGQRGPKGDIQGSSPKDKGRLSG